MTSVAQLSSQRACRSFCRHASEVCTRNHPTASRVRQMETHQVSYSCRGCVTRFMVQVEWSRFAGGLRSAIARDAVLPTLFEREVLTSHQVCIGGQTPGSPISGQDLGDPCVEVVLPDPILAVAPAIWWAPRKSRRFVRTVRQVHTR